MKFITIFWQEKRGFIVKVVLVAFLISSLLAGGVLYFDMLDHPNDYCRFARQIQEVSGQLFCASDFDNIVLSFFWIALIFLLITAVPVLIFLVINFFIKYK